jgi:tetratricopeptide (TPR) repeat protein
LEEPMEQQVVLKACKHAFCFRCVTDWQAHTRKTTMLAAEHAAVSCPYCRQESENSVVEDTRENAGLIAFRARKLPENDPDRKKYFEFALAEVDKLLVIDEGDLSALVLKGHILRHHNNPEGAIEVIKNALEWDKEGSANLKILETMCAEANLAFASGDHVRGRRLRGSLEAYHVSGVFMYQLGKGPRRLFDVMIDLAEAYEAVGKWQEALDIYIDMELENKANIKTACAQQTGTLYAGGAKCLHRLGQYDPAIKGGKAALAMYRQHPGGHKLVALSQLALGQVEAARTTMRRGIVYEDPWDDENRQKNIEFLQECLRAETAEGGV